MWSLSRDFIGSPWRGIAPVREGTETDGCDGRMNGVGVELAQVFFGLVDLLGESRYVVCPAGFGSVLGEGLAGIESMLTAELPGDSGFALLGESLLAVARMAGPPKRNQKVLPLHSGLAALDFPRSIAAPGAGVQGPSMALYASRGIHAARSPTQRLRSAS